MCQSLSCKHIHLYIHSEKRVRNTPLREILLQYTFKWLRVVSLTTTTKNNKHLELYQKEQMLVVTYKNTASISKPTCTELNQYIPVRACDAEEVNQKIVKHALNLPRNGYKNILIRTVDTDVLNLLISYFSQFELDDVNVYAHDKL